MGKVNECSGTAVKAVYENMLEWSETCTLDLIADDQSSFNKYWALQKTASLFGSNPKALAEYLGIEFPTEISAVHRDAIQVEPRKPSNQITIEDLTNYYNK